MVACIKWSTCGVIVLDCNVSTAVDDARQSIAAGDTQSSHSRR